MGCEQKWCVSLPGLVIQASRHHSILLNPFPLPAGWKWKTVITALDYKWKPVLIENGILDHPSPSKLLEINFSHL